MSKTHQKGAKLKRGASLFLLIGICLFSLSSCNDINGCDSSESVEDLKLDVELLESRVKWLEEDLDKRFKEYLELSEKVSLLEIKDESKASAFFCVSKGVSDGFQVVDSSSGSFLVSLKEVTPYLSGYKLVFSIGNPSLATYDNAKLKVSWNRSYQNWKDDKEHAAKMEEYEKAYKEYLSKLSSKEDGIKRPEMPKRLYWWEEKKEKEFTLQSSINPGSWNAIEVHVTPATLEQLDSVEVSIETTTIRLIKEQGVKS